MRRVCSRGWLLVVGLLIGTIAAAHGQINLTFPSSDSLSGGPTGTGALGSGGGFVHFQAGDDLRKTFADTDIVSADSSRWVFSMSDITAVGVVNTFDAQINGIDVGSFSFAGDSSMQVHNFDLTFTHAAPIAGDDYELRIVATSSVPPGDGAWNWIAGGNVTLSGIEAAAYWDANGAAAGSGNAGGNWADARWTQSAAGTTATSNFVSGQKAIFSAGVDGVGPFTVNVNTSTNVKGIAFQEGGVTLAAAGGVLTLTAPTIDVQSPGATATIAAPLIGSVGLTKAGVGALVLTGGNNFAGATTISQGTLQLGAGATAGSLPSGSVITLGNAATGASDVAFLVNRSDLFTLSNNIVVSSQGTGSATIGSSGNAPGPLATIFSGSLTLNRPTTLQGTDPDRTTYTGVISGNVGTLTIAGGGRTTWENTNTFVGDIVVAGAGTILQVGAAAAGNRIPDGSSVDLGAGTTLRLFNHSETIDALTGIGTVRIIGTANATLSVGAGGGSGEFSGVLENGTATLSLTKTGAGTQTLSGINTYTGLTTVSGGALRIANAAALGSTAGATTVASGARLELAGGINVSGETLNLSGTGGGLGALYSASGTNTWSGPINFNTSDVTFGAAAGQTLIVATGITSGATSAVHIGGEGGGLVRLTGPNTYIGGTTIHSGGISIASPSQLGNPSGAALLNFAGHGTLQVTASFSTTKEFIASGPDRSITFDIDAGQTLTASGNIRSTGGAGSVVKTGGGTLVLTASNTQLDSDIVLQQGTLDVRHAGALGNTAASDFVIASGGTTTRLAFDAPTAVTASFQPAGSGASLLVDRVTAGGAVAHSLTNLTLDGAHVLNVGAGSNITSGTAGLAFTGTTTLGGDATLTVDDSPLAEMRLSLAGVTGAGRSLTIAGSGDTTISGAVSTTTGGLTKQGTGTLELSAISAYSGATNVEQGTLRLAGGSIAASSLTTVASGATLTGSGTTGALTIAGGGTHAPGTGVGVANVLGNYDQQGTLSIEFGSAGGAAGVDHDLVDVTGGVTIDATTSALATAYLGAAGTFNPAFAQVFTIVRNDGADAVAGHFAGLAPGSAVLIDSKQMNIYYDQGTGNDVVLVSNVGVASQLFVNDEWTAAATVDGDRETPAADTAFVGVNAFASTSAALAAQPNFSGPLRLNAGDYAVIDVTAAGPGAPGDVVLQLAHDASAPVPQADIRVQNLQGDAGDSIVTQFHGATGGNLIVEQGLFAGNISGSGSLTKTSPGTLVVSGNNSYSGGTTIEGGILRPTTTASLPAGVSVSAGGTLDLLGLDFLAAGRDATIAGNGAAGAAGALTNTSATAASIRHLTLAADATIGTSSGDLRVGGTIDGGAHALSIGGSGTTIIAADNALTNLSGINVSSGRLRLESSQAPIAPLTVQVAAGATLESWSTAGRTYSGNLSVALAGGTLEASGTGGKATWQGPLQLSGSSTIAAHQPLELAGSISGAGTLAKQGNSTLVLSSGSTFSGVTNVESGTLIVNDETSGQGDYKIASGARLGGRGKIGLATGSRINVSAFPGELSPGAADVPYAPPPTPVGYAGHTFDATYSAGLDPATAGTFTIDGDVELGGYLLHDLIAHDEHDLLDVSGTLTIGPTAQLEINGQTDFTQLDFYSDLGFAAGVRSEIVSADEFFGEFSNMLVNQAFIDAGGHSMFFGNDGTHLFLLAQQAQAVPEPATLALWLLGALIVAATIRRCRRGSRV